MATRTRITGDHKVCPRCETEKSYSEFNRDGSKRDGLSSYCTLCQREYIREHRQELRGWLHEQKSGPCADCGETFHPVAMHYDHLPGSYKEMGVSQMVTQTYSEGALQAEIAKCELVCANCHAVRTWDRAQG